ncbi:MAG: ABC transporter permease [Candidatus Nanohaloarchaeota archaeon]|nr:ABC transporter permease [Candidatus Nanohaloarchaeota archaeon]
MYKKRNELKVAVFLAWKNLIFKKKTIAMIAAIIGLGFLSATFSSSVITGLRVMIEDKAIYSLTGNIVLEPPVGEDYITNVKEIEKKIRNIPGVESIDPRLAVGAVMYDPVTREKVPFTLYIVDAEREALTTWIDDAIVEGSFISKGTKNGIVIGGALTKKYSISKSLPTLDVSTGENVLIVLPSLGTKEVKVKGIYSLQFIATETFGFINKEQAMSLLNLSHDDLDKASMILIKTTEKGKEKEVIDMLKRLGLNVRIYSWQEKLGTIAQFTDSLQIISKITMVIGLIISFGTIYIMIYVNIMQKRSQIGILKALGINENTILYSYILQGMFYGLVGIATGYLLTYVLVSYFSTHPIPMPMGDVTPVLEYELYRNISLLLFGVSVLAGYLASRNAVKDKILDMIFKG